MTRPFVSSTGSVLEWYRSGAKPSEWSFVLDSISRQIVLGHGWSEKAQRRLFTGLDRTQGQLFDLIYPLVSRMTRVSGNSENLVDFETGTSTLVDLIASEEFRKLKGLRVSNPSGEEQPLDSFERMFGKFCAIAREINVVDAYVFADWISGPNNATTKIFDYLANCSTQVVFHGVDPTLIGRADDVRRDRSASRGQFASLLRSFESAEISAKFYKPSIPGKNGRQATKFPHLRLIKFDFDGGNPIVAVLDQGLASFGAGTVNSVQEVAEPLELWRETSQKLKVTEINLPST